MPRKKKTDDGWIKVRIDNAKLRRASVLACDTDTPGRIVLIVDLDEEVGVVVEKEKVDK